VTMRHLSSEQLTTLRDQLEHEREALLRLRHQETVAAVAAAEQTQDVGDRQDAAASEAANLAQWTLADHERLRLAEIEAALQRMVDGTYGVCELSDEEIPFARLRSEPTARATVEAQAEAEAAAGRGRPDADERRRGY
jgi:DnaK suppressor protein